MTGEHQDVAVVIPCFNEAVGLRAAVESVRSDPSLLEVIVIDDGSDDPSCLATLETLSREGVRVLRQENRGPSAATMAGIDATTARYVARLDADDEMATGVLAELARALDDDPRAAAAWGDVQTYGRTNFLIPGVPQLDPWLLTFTNCLPGAGCLMRRSAVLAVGGWQLRDGWEDWDLFLALAAHGWTGVHVGRVTLIYRRDMGGRNTDSDANAAAYYAELRYRHPRLFADRAASRRRSDAPAALKALVVLIEVTPGLPRLLRIQLCELATRALWCGSLRAASEMLWQGVRLRAWRAHGSGEQ